MRYALALLAICSSVWLQAQTKKEALSLENIHLYGTTNPKGVYGIRHMDNGTHYSLMENGKVVMYDYKKGSSEVLFDTEDAKKQGMEYKMDNYEISKSGDRLLIQTNTTSIYRHSKKATYYIWDFTTKKLSKLFNGAQVFYATFSPDETKAAFVFENNLIIEDFKPNTMKQITSDGEMNHVLNGMTDWVYEEEFALIRAFEWSPNGKYIAYLRFDESAVKEYQIPVYKSASYPEMYTYKYPKAGEDNSKIQLITYDVKAEKGTKIDLGSDEDIYIPRIMWTPQNKLCFQRLNRLQNHFELLMATPGKKTSTVVYSEKSETYIDVTDDLTFIDGGKSFIISSEQDGYNHLYHYGIDGTKMTQITTGKFDVTSFEGYDEKSKTLYYQAAEKSPMERHLYSIKLTGSSKNILLEEAGTHSASFSSDFKHYLHTYSDINTPPVVSIKKGSKTVRVLEDNEKFKAYWAELGTQPMEFFTVKAADGLTDLNGWKIEPKGFDKTKSYPLLMFVYGGPGSQMVKNSWYTSNKAWFQYLASKGYYIACVDNRGTGARGVEFKKCTYKTLGQIETQDQIAAAEQLAALDYIDANRVGMFGWSYGGFMASLCLSKGEVFTTAVAVAPVSSWEYYDNIYTERYMQRPIDNKDGYENTRVFNFVDGMRGKDYLLVHGTFDDNVHPQNAFEIMNALVSKNISFDSELYVNKNHGIYGGYTRIHLYKKMTAFIEESMGRP